MPDAHYLSSAVGWLGLGNCHEAGQELEKIQAELQTHPDVLSVRFEILGKEGKWAEAAKIAQALRKADPKESQWCLKLAYATRRMADGGLASARQILTAGHKQFPKEPIIAFNLACYECQLGEKASALDWLKKAFVIGDQRSLKRMALADTDLEPLWPEITAL